MSSKSQRKGADGERELAAILRERGYDCQRGGSLTFGEIPDVVGLPGSRHPATAQIPDRAGPFPSE